MPNILLVEDQTLFRENLAEALEEHDHAVFQASDAAGALALLENGRFDLFLLDMALPGMSGPDLLRAIRVFPDLRRVPAIFLTAYPRVEALEEASRLGVGDFLVKSDISLMDLLERIEKESSIPPQGPVQEELAVVACRHIHPALRRWRPVPDRAQVQDLFLLARGPVAVPELAAYLAIDPDAARWLRRIGGTDSSPEDAVRLLLVRAVADAVVRSVVSSIDMRRLWRCSLAMGLLAQKFFHEGGFSSPLEGFLAGFCSQVPWIFCLQALENEYAQVRAQAWEHGRPITEELAGAFGCDERSLCLEVLRSMDLPDPVWKAVLDLHGGGGSRWKPGQGGSLLSSIQQLAIHLEPIWNPCAVVRGIAVQEAPWLAAACADALVLPELVRNFSRMAASKAFPEAAACDPIRLRATEDGRRRIAYFPNPAAVAPDVLERVLRLIGDVEIVRTPQALARRGDAVRVAWVEPETDLWEHLMEQPRRTVILHNRPLPLHAPLGAHADIRLPAPFAVLERELRPRGRQ